MMRPPLAILALLALAGPIHASPLIWAGLFLGENRSEGPQAPPLLASRLQAVFGFTNYRLVRGENIDLRNNWGHWVMARKDFFLRVEALPPTPDEPEPMGYEIYKDGFIVARGRCEITPATPLFINGPDFRRGRLIFVVESR